MEYLFTLKYQLVDDERDMDVLVERLGDAGCDDALVGIGQPGRLALEFSRIADNADAAVRSAIADVECAIPSAHLIEVTPDLVGLTDVAEILGMSRQNMRKIMITNPGTFPAPVHEGSASIWHLVDVLEWLQIRGYAPEPNVSEVAAVASQVNLRERLRLSEGHPVSSAFFILRSESTNTTTTVGSFRVSAGLFYTMDSHFTASGDYLHVKPWRDRDNFEGSYSMAGAT